MGRGWKSLVEGELTQAKNIIRKGIELSTLVGRQTQSHHLVKSLGTINYL